MLNLTNIVLFEIALVSHHPPVELAVGRTRLQSARAAQQPISVAKPTTTPPRDDVGDPDIALDLNLPLP